MKKIKLLFPILLLILLVLGFFWRQATMQGLFFAADEIASDLLDFAYPYKEFYAAELKKGEIVTWNPYIGLGTPTLAEVQTGIFNPFNLLLFYFLPTPLAFNWRIISSFILLGVSTYLYGRTIKLSVAGSFLAAVSFIFSGFLIGHLKHVPMVQALELAPLAFLAVEKIITSKKKLFFSILLSLVLSFSVFAGHLTSSYLLGLILVIYFFLRVLQERKERESFFVYFCFFGALGLSLFLAAIQVLAVFEVAPFSTRAETSLVTSLTMPFLPQYLLFFLKPDIFGDPSRGTWNMLTANYWENLGYIGLLPLLLALLAILKLVLKKKEVLVLLVILGLSLALTLGSLTPLYKFFWDFLPGFSVTRLPGRFLFFVEFALVILAGFGLDYLRKKIKVKNLTVLLIILFTVVEFFYFGYSYNNAVSLKILEEPETAKFIKETNANELFRIKSTDRGAAWQEAWQKAKGWRVNLQPYLDYWPTLSSDHNLLYRLASPSLIYQLKGHFGLLRPGELDAAAAQADENQKGWLKLYGLLNVKYFLSPGHLDPFKDKLQPVFSQKMADFEVKVSENPQFLPRALVVPDFKVLEKDKVLEYMKSSDFQPTQELILEEDPGLKAGFNLRGSIVKIIDYQNTRVEILTQMTNPGFLLLTDTWYPGWKAEVDGQETKIYLADYNFRAVYLDKGEHKITFFYEPTYYKMGFWISLLSFSLVLLSLLFLSFRLFFKKSYA